MRALFVQIVFALFVLAAPVPLGAEGVPPAPDALGGSEWTAVGAERAGNAEGTIPPWTGGIRDWPAGYEVGDHHLDPYGDDPVLFTIDATNVAHYAEFLSEGQRVLLETYPDTWRLKVYPTRRSASYPDWVYDAVRENARSATLITEGKGGVAGARISSPFPIPRRGVEVVWNHTLRFRGVRVHRTNGVAAVTRRGRYGLVLIDQDLAFPYSARDTSTYTRKFPNILLAVKSKIIQPPLLAGGGALELEPVDQTRDPRKSWTYIANLRRVVRNPVFAYAFDAPNSEGLRTVDDSGMFNGPPDRFDWKLLGKRELFIPYNAYRLHSDQLALDEVLAHHHINPEVARYERHRVWVVEGTLKPGLQHIYSRRRFYVDEDSWQIAVAESWDLDGKLWRVNESHAINYYEVPVHWSTLDIHHDLKAKRYLAVGLDNDRIMYRFSESGDPREFTPASLFYYVR